MIFWHNKINRLWCKKLINWNRKIPSFNCFYLFSWVTAKNALGHPVWQDKQTKYSSQSDWSLFLPLPPCFSLIKYASHFSLFSLYALQFNLYGFLRTSVAYCALITVIFAICTVFGMRFACCFCWVHPLINLSNSFLFSLFSFLSSISLYLFWSSEWQYLLLFTRHQCWFFCNVVVYMHFTSLPNWIIPDEYKSFPTIWIQELILSGWMAKLLENHHHRHLLLLLLKFFFWSFIYSCLNWQVCTQWTIHVPSID